MIQTNITVDSSSGLKNTFCHEIPCICRSWPLLHVQRKNQSTRKQNLLKLLPNFFFFWLLVPISFPVFKFWRQKFSAANYFGAKGFAVTYLQGLRLTKPRKANSTKVVAI